MSDPHVTISDPAGLWAAHRADPDSATAHGALVAHYTPLAHATVARTHAKRAARVAVDLPLGDLLACGQRALSEAVARWNPHAPANPFTDYATRTIGYAIHAALNEERRRHLPARSRPAAGYATAHFEAFASATADRLLANPLLRTSAAATDVAPVAQAALAEAFCYYDRRNNPGGFHDYAAGVIRARVLEHLDDDLTRLGRSLPWDELL